MDSNISLLKTIDLFSGFSEDEIQTLIGMGEISTYAPNDLIIEEGESGNEMYIVLEGTVRITKKISRDGVKAEQQFFGDRKAGDIIGEMALLNESPRSARVTALTSTRMLVLKEAHFAKLLTTNPQLVLAIIRGLSKRLRESNEYTIRELEEKNQQLAELNANLERKVIERTAELHQRNEELEKLNKRKNEILGICAHDLKNPITIIQGYAELKLEIEMSPEDSKQLNEETIEHCGDMISIINKLLDISAIENGRVNLDLLENNIVFILQSRVDAFQHTASKKSIKLALSVPEDFPNFVFDALKISEILDNLISNAIKYSYPRTTVQVKAWAEGTVAKVEVKDEGQGLTEEDMNLAFKEFQKLSARPTAGESSAGLGLAIVKKLVELHHGEVWLRSDGLGKGATFGFSLPMKKMSEQMNL